jgi:hypothetical protein
LDSQILIKETIVSKAQQGKSLAVLFSKIIQSLRISIAGSSESKLISAIFQPPSSVVATAIHDGNCLTIKDMSCMGNSALLAMSRRILPEERPALHILE